MKGFFTNLNVSSPYVKVIITLFVFAAAALLADLLVDKVLRRFARLTKTEADNTILDIVHRPLFLTIITIGIIASVAYLTFSEKIFFHIRSALYTFLTILWGITIIRVGKVIIGHSTSNVSDSTGLRKEIVPLIENVMLVVVLAIGVFFVLDIWKINITPLLASAGIAGAIVAFAAKDAFANLLGGVSIFIDRPFKMGDYVVLDAKERGEVVTIGLRSTRIKTRDDVLITIPNSIIANSKIINESAPYPKFRVRIPVSVAYGSDIDKVEQVLINRALANGNVVSDPAPRVRFREFGDSSLNFELLCWVNEPVMRGLTIHELNSSIYKSFGAEGISIPFPQRDVHLYTSEGRAGDGS